MVKTPAALFETRLAVPEDAALIAGHRRRMFVDSGQADDARMAIVVAEFEPWVRERLAAGSYVGWLTYPVSEPEHVVAGAGMFLMDFPPHFLDAGSRRAYLLNFYVDPELRGHGLARKLLELATADAGRRGIGVVSLHASVFGKPLYELNGFKVSNEMQLRTAR